MDGAFCEQGSSKQPDPADYAASPGRFEDEEPRGSPRIIQRVAARRAGNAEQEKKRLPEVNVVPGGQRTCRFVPGAIGRLQSTASMLGCGPTMIAGSLEVDKTTVDLHADRRRFAVRRNVLDTSPVQTRSRGCHASPH